MLEEAISNFKNNTDVSRLGRNLRNLILHYQTVVNDGQPFNMEDLLTDILPLFELLDNIE